MTLPDPPMPPCSRPSPVRWFGAVLLAAASVAAQAADLTVSAAASLTDAFKDIGSAFERQSPGDHVQFNFGASGALLQQILKGAPVDVFASADMATMDQAAAQKLVAPGASRPFARNRLVVVTPAGATASAPTSLGDLARSGVQHVAIGLPASVPVGRYTKAVLETARLWPAIEAKMVGATSVRQVLDYVARGEVDAGFVYATDAALMPDKVKLAFTVPTETPVLYPIAMLAASGNAAAAQRFVDYVLSPAGQAVLVTYGFGKP